MLRRRMGKCPKSTPAGVAEAVESREHTDRVLHQLDRVAAEQNVLRDLVHDLVAGIIERNEPDGGQGAT